MAPSRPTLVEALILLLSLEALRDPRRFTPPSSLLHEVNTTGISLEKGCRRSRAMNPVSALDNDFTAFHVKREAQRFAARPGKIR